MQVKPITKPAVAEKSFPRPRLSFLVIDARDPKDYKVSIEVQMCEAEGKEVGDTKRLTLRKFNEAVDNNDKLKALATALTTAAIEYMVAGKQLEVQGDSPPQQ